MFKRVILSLIVSIALVGCIPPAAVKDRSTDYTLIRQATKLVYLESVGNGSGVMIAPQRLLTAGHVANMHSVERPLMVDGEAVIRVIKMEFDYDKKDLAILEVKSGCPCVPLGDLPKVDGEVALIGFPYSTGFQGLQVQVLTLGRLQGYSPGLDRIVTTSPAAPGNSGGGLFTHKDGQWFLIGILVQGAGIGGPTHLSLSVPYKTIVEFLKGPLD